MPDNGLSPARCQTTIWTNVGMLLIGSLETNFIHQNRIYIIQENAFENVVCKMTAILSRSRCFIRVESVSPYIICSNMLTYCDKSDLFYDMVILVPGKGELVANRECRPFGHYWDYYSGALSLRQVAATRLKIGYLRIALLDEFQTWPHSMTGCRDGIVLAIMMTSSNGSIFRVTGPLWGESTGGFPL